LGAKLKLPIVEVFLRMLILVFPWFVETRSILPSPSKSPEESPAGFELTVDPTAILSAASNEPALN
jgi:hypothetical protein